jgi:Ras-related protein Rab-4B
VLRFAQENGLMFLEASAKTGECVEEAFLKCSKSILAKIETGELDPERIGSGTSVLHIFSLENAGQENSCICYRTM